MSYLTKTFSWTIHNFDLALHLTGECLESPSFSIDAMKNTKFSLLLYSVGTKCRRDVSLYVKRHRDNAEESISLKYELCVIDESGKYPKASIWGSSDFFQGTRKGSRKFFGRQFPFLRDNKLTVLCRMGPLKYNFYPLMCWSISDCLSLAKDFAALQDTGNHSDLVIEVGEEKFRVHRVILEARCLGLVRRLATTENSGVMALKDIEAPVLRAILYYAYAGAFKDTELLGEVLAAANKYKLVNLKTFLFPSSDTVSAETVIQCFQTSFQWLIPGFNNFPQSSEYSRLLMTDDMPENSWMKVSFFCKESGFGRKGTFIKFQKLGHDNTGVVYVKIQTSDKNGKLTLLNESFNVFENGNFVMPFDIGMKSDEMLVNGDLQLHFGIRVSTNYRENTIKEVAFNNEFALPFCNPVDCITLHEDMLHFYENMKTGDVTLSIGTQKLPAHKAVLCSRSEVFRKMFEHDSLESQTNSVNVEDVDVETMTSVLMYMYCCTTRGDLDVARAIKLYSAADKYQVLHLKERCCHYLKSEIDADNVGEVLLLADAYFDEGLKKCVHEFITGNASRILQSERGLKVLENRGDLYRDILNVLLQRVSLSEKSEGDCKKN